jgi:hypothetical protein
MERRREDVIRTGVFRKEPAPPVLIHVRAEFLDAPR